MRTNELSVGDWVICDGTPRRLAAVHLKKVGWHSSNDRLSWTRIDRVQPVTVTPDLLRRNSFTEDKIVNGWYRRTFPEGKTVSVFLHEIFGKHVSYDFWVEQPFDGQVRQTKACRVVNTLDDIMLLKREQVHRSMADVDGLHALQHAMSEAGITMEWGVADHDMPEERQEIDPVMLEYVITPEQSWQLLTNGMPRESADQKAVPFNPQVCGMTGAALGVIIASGSDFDPMANRGFGAAYVTWTNGRLISLLPERLNLQLEYPLTRHIYRHGDNYVVGYESHVQKVEYRKADLSQALVSMVRYLLQYDFIKSQMNLNNE